MGPTLFGVKFEAMPINNDTLFSEKFGFSKSSSPYGKVDVLYLIQHTTALYMILMER